MYQISNLLAQQIVDTLREICGYHINFIDTNGLIFASTDESRIGVFHEIGKTAAETGKMIEVGADDHFVGAQQGVNLPVKYKGRTVSVIGISGRPEDVRKYAYLAGKIAKVLIQEKELDQFSRSQTEKRHYIIDTLINRETENYAYLSALLKEFRIPVEGEGRLFLLRQVDPNLALDSDVERDVAAIFELHAVKIFAHRYPDDYLAFVAEQSVERVLGSLKQYSAVQDGRLQIAVGKRVPVLQAADSYDTCLTAMKSIDVFHDNCAVFDMLTLEIILSSVGKAGRRTYQEKTISAISEDEQKILSCYFENDMSLRQTCGQLFLHQNTLQNKLNTIYKKSGYNPRKFRDAMVLYLALRLKEN